MSQGAKVSGQKPLVGSYIGNHKKALIHTLKEQAKSPVAASLTCTVIGIAILLPTLLAVLLINIQSAKIDWDTTAQMTVMLEQNVSALQGQAISKKIAKRMEVEHAEFIDRDTALKEFKALFELDATLTHLTENPLPHSILITLNEQASTLEKAQALKNQIAAFKDVDLVQLDLMWVQRLAAISSFLSLSAWILGLMLSVAVVLVLGNTVRLAIENRKEEIAVLKLVGGTNAFVCRPFLYLGVFYGLGGGIISLILCSIVLTILSYPIESLTSSYQSDFSLSGLNIETTLLILIVGTFLGWVGARLSVKQHISAIEPN